MTLKVAELMQTGAEMRHVLVSLSACAANVLRKIPDWIGGNEGENGGRKQPLPSQLTAPGAWINPWSTPSPARAPPPLKEDAHIDLHGVPSSTWIKHPSARRCDCCER